MTTPPEPRNSRESRGQFEDSIDKIARAVAFSLAILSTVGMILVMTYVTVEGEQRGYGFFSRLMFSVERVEANRTMGERELAGRAFIESVRVPGYAVCPDAKKLMASGLPGEERWHDWMQSKGRHRIEGTACYEL